MKFTGPAGSVVTHASKVACGHIVGCMVGVGVGSSQSDSAGSRCARQAWAHAGAVFDSLMISSYGRTPNSLRLSSLSIIPFPSKIPTVLTKPTS